MSAMWGGGLREPNPEPCTGPDTHPGYRTAPPDGCSPTVYHFLSLYNCNLLPTTSRAWNLPLPLPLPLLTSHECNPSPASLRSGTVCSFTATRSRCCCCCTSPTPPGRAACGEAPGGGGGGRRGGGRGAEGGEKNAGWRWLGLAVVGAGGGWG